MAVQQVPTGDDTLEMRGEFVGFTPDLLFSYWVRPDLLKQWWPREAEVDPHTGGAYTLSWPERGRTLRGTIMTIVPGESLAFTWRWDSTPPEDATLNVSVTFEPLDDGASSRLTLAQGPYTDTPHDQEERTSHLEGWNYFLAKLQSLAPADDWTRNVVDES